MLKKNQAVKIVFVLFFITLSVSISLNIFLYQRSRQYYLVLNSIRLDPLNLDAYSAETYQPSPDKSLLVFFGDSRAAGWIAPTEIPEVTFINRGVGGQTTSQVLGRFSDHVLPLKADIIVIQVGINDLKTIPIFPNQKEAITTNCKSNIQKIVDASLQSGADVILTTIFPLGQPSIRRSLLWSDDVAVTISDVNEFIKSLGDEQVTILDTTEILANDDGMVDPLYREDFLHINEKGYGALNRELIQVLP